MRKKSRAGYTLIEVMIAATIFVSVVGVGVATYASASSFQSKSAVIQETNQGARYAFDRIVNDIKSADAVGINNDGTELNLFSFMSGTTIIGNKVSSGTTITPIAVYFKGTGDCSDYVKQVVYYQGIRGTDAVPHYTIKQYMRYIDMNYSPVTTGSCGITSDEDFLPSTVELKDDTDSSFSISGTDPRSDGTPATTAPEVTLKMQFIPANMNNNSLEEEKRVVELRTSVTPRLGDY